MKMKIKFKKSGILKAESEKSFAEDSSLADRIQGGSRCPYLLSPRTYLLFFAPQKKDRIQKRFWWFNPRWTALYEGVTVIFLAQAAGVDLGLSQQAVVAGWALIASLGTAGVPGGTLPMIAAVLASLGVLS